MNALQKLNGKKRYLIGGGTVSGGLAWWLVKTLMALNTAVAVNATTNNAQAEDIRRVKETPTAIARVEKDVEAINGSMSKMENDIGKIETEQRIMRQDVNTGFAKVNEDMSNGFKEVLKEMKR